MYLLLAGLCVWVVWVSVSEGGWVGAVACIVFLAVVLYAATVAAH